MKTTEENRLIAEFMGLKPESVSDDRYFDCPNLYYNYDGLGNFQIANTCYPENMIYHKSWDWLMPVVMKIETMGFDVNIKGITCSVSRVLETETVVQLVLGEKSRKIELVHSTCVLFIKWYNKTN